MRKTYNIDEDIQRIKTGDTVLISGLYGKNFNFINNKTGKVLSIVIHVENGITTQLSNIKLDETGKEYVVNFDFIYKLNFYEAIVDGVSQHIFTIDNPAIYYVHKKKLRHMMNFQDELKQSMSIGVDKGGKSHVLLFSGIN